MPTTKRDKAKCEAAKIAKQQRAVAAKTKGRASKGITIPEGIKQSDWGTIYNTYENCWLLLEMNAETWGMGFDVLKEAYVFRGETPWDAHYGDEVTPDLVRGIRNWLLDAFDTEFSKVDIEDAMLSLCRARPFNSICEYLDALKWDGVPRIDSWLHTYFGAPDDPYHRAIGRRWLLGAVARARRPGTKFDTALIFEAEQGSGKTTAVQVLVGGRWFSNSSLGDLDNRDSAIALQGVWIYELGELNDVTRSNTEAVKRYLSINVDRYRGINEKRRSDHPRITVFVGTTNKWAYLVDMTGDRRMWCCKTSGEVDLAAIVRDRDMIWAEAAAIEAEAMKTESDIPLGMSRPSLTLPRELWPIAAKHQAERRNADPWVDSAKMWLQQEGGDRVHANDMLERCFHIAKGDQRTDHKQRLSSVMQAIGWRHRPQLRIGKVTGVSGYVRESIMVEVEDEEAEANGD